MTRQTTWGLLALGNFLLGGAGAGAYIVTAALYWSPQGVPQGLLLAETLASVALVVSGLACVFLEAGRKRRAVNAILNVRTSWMSREAGAASLFVLAGAAALVVQSAYLIAVAFASAVALAASHGFVLRAAKAIPAWTPPAAPPLVWASSLGTGAAVATAVSLLYGPLPAGYPFMVTAVAASTVLVFSVAYGVLARADPDLKEPLSEGRNMLALVASALVGGAVPLLLSLLEESSLTEALAVSCLLAGSSSLKYVLILRMSYLVPVMRLDQPAYIFPASK